MGNVRTLVAAGVVALALSSSAVTQNWSDRDDHYSQKEAREQKKLYDKGFKDGEKDRKHHHAFQIRNHKFDDRNDREAYVSGYQAGYESGVYRY
jgi:hypothetical protein